MQLIQRKLDSRILMRHNDARRGCFAIWAELRHTWTRVSELSWQLGTYLDGSLKSGLWASRNAKIVTYKYAIKNAVLESAFV